MKSQAGSNPVKIVVAHVNEIVSGAVAEGDIKRIVRQGSYAINTAIILSDATDKPESLMTPIEKMDIVRVGVSKKDLESLKKITVLGI